jgi:hypothetical protein
MRTKPKIPSMIISAATCLCALCACQAHRQSQASVTTKTGSSAADAQSQYRSSIRGLHPIRVYDDHGNTVVVQKMVDGIESGKYIVPLVSSYIPFGGEGGFILTPGTGGINPDLEAEVYDYRKCQQAPAGNPAMSPLFHVGRQRRGGA